MKKQGVLIAAVILGITGLSVSYLAGGRSVLASRAVPAKKATAALSANASQVPVDVQQQNPTQTDWLNFGWQTFVALDWPALSPNSGGAMGQPDPSSSPGATSSNGAFVPAVWNTFRDVSTVMLANGVDPGSTYSQPVKVAGSCQALGGGNPIAPGFEPLYINNASFSQTSLQRDYVNQASTGPLVDQKGWYTLEEILVDPSEYAYIQGNGYYLGQNQVNAYKAKGQLVGFPNDGQGMNLPAWAQYGALEIKATWRVLDASDKAVTSRYYTQWGYFLQADGTTCEGPVLFGLIGLHILRLTPTTGGTWFWASFEQVDNTMPPSGIPATLAAANTPNGACTSQYNVTPTAIQGNIPWTGSSAPNDICQVTLIPPDVQAVNQVWMKQLQGTVWQYYQMVNTLNPCATGDSSCYSFQPINDPKNTINLNAYANTAIESYFQTTGTGSSQTTTTCMSCHGFASGNGAPSPLTGTNQIFTFVLLNAYMPSPSAAAGREKLLRLFRNPPPVKLAAPVKANGGTKSKN